MPDFISPLFLARDHILWRHHVVNHPNGVSLCCPSRMINIDSKNTRQLILICHINCTTFFLKSRTLALRKHDISQMEFLESRTISADALLDIVDFEDNIRAGGISIRCIGHQCIFKRFFGAAGLSMLK